MRTRSAADDGAGAGTDPDPHPHPHAVLCQWEQELRSVGDHGLVLPVAFRVGMPVAALCAIVAAAAVAVSVPRAAEHAGPVGLVLLGLAAVPWLMWLAAGDDDRGPTASFATLALLPLTGLAVGGRLAETVGLGSDLADPLLRFPVLLAVLLFVAFSTVRLAVAVAVAGYAALAVPVGLGWVLGAEATIGPDPAGGDVVTWHVGFALCVAAGYAVRLSYLAHQEVVRAREARAQQEAADERRQVARDVHDVVAHSLAVTMLHVTAARMAVVRSSPAEAEDALVEAERHGRASLNDIRRIVGLLRADDSSSLAAAQPGLADVDDLLAGFRAAGLAVEETVNRAAPAGSSSAATELAVYRVLQEALANAVRHGTGAAVVDLECTADRVRLTVTNPVAGRPEVSRDRGSGLLGMRERVSAAGGTVEAGWHGGRWVVHAVLPNGAADPVTAELPVSGARDGLVPDGLVPDGLVREAGVRDTGVRDTGEPAAAGHVTGTARS